MNPNSNEAALTLLSLGTSTAFDPLTYNLYEDTSGVRVVKRSTESDSDCDATEYPDGEIKIMIMKEPHLKKIDILQCGWATYVSGAHTSRVTKLSNITKKCLGIFQCPIENCPFMQRPRVPKKIKGGGIEMIACTKICPNHKKELKHILCNSIILIKELHDAYLVEHHGIHRHRRPPAIRANPEITG